MRKKNPGKSFIVRLEYLGLETEFFKDKPIDSNSLNEFTHESTYKKNSRSNYCTYFVYEINGYYYYYEKFQFRFPFPLFKSSNKMQALFRSVYGRVFYYSQTIHLYIIHVCMQIKIA